MTWAEILHRPGTFVRLDGGTLDIGIIRGPDGKYAPDFSESFAEALPVVSAPRGGITYIRPTEG